MAFQFFVQVSCLFAVSPILGHHANPTVDGRNPAPVDRWFIPLFIGVQPSKVVLLPSTVGATIFWDCQAIFSVLLWPKHVFFNDDAVSLLVNQHGDP